MPNKIIVCQERPGCCLRRYIPDCCNNFRMKCLNIQDGGKMCLEMVRESACSLNFLCSDPSIKVYYTEGPGEKEYLGRVFAYKNCCSCNPVFEVQDSNDAIVYQIIPQPC